MKKQKTKKVLTKNSKKQIKIMKNRKNRKRKIAKSY